MASRTAGVVTLLFVLSFALLASTNGSAPASAALPAASSMQAVDNNKMAEVGARLVCVYVFVCESMHICMCWVLLLGNSSQLHGHAAGRPSGRIAVGRCCRILLFGACGVWHAAEWNTGWCVRGPGR